MKVLRACAVTAIAATMVSLGASVALRGEDNTVRETRARIVAAGQSFDTMERLNGKWLLKTRDVAAKD